MGDTGAICRQYVGPDHRWSGKGGAPHWQWYWRLGLQLLFGICCKIALGLIVTRQYCYQSLISPCVAVVVYPCVASYTLVWRRRGYSAKLYKAWDGTHQIVPGPNSLFTVSWNHQMWNLGLSLQRRQWSYRISNMKFGFVDCRKTLGLLQWARKRDGRGGLNLFAVPTDYALAQCVSQNLRMSKILGDTRIWITEFSS